MKIFPEFFLRRQEYYFELAKLNQKYPEMNSRPCIRIKTKNPETDYIFEYFPNEYTMRIRTIDSGIPGESSWKYEYNDLFTLENIEHYLDSLPKNYTSLGPEQVVELKKWIYES